MGLQISPLSPFIIRIWMPILAIAFVSLLFSNASLVYWLSAVPLLLVVVFMMTLAEVHDEGETIRVGRLFTSVRIAKADVKSIAPSFLEGIGALRLQRYVFPWGRIYFVTWWSHLGDAASTVRVEPTVATTGPRAILEYCAVILSGLIAGVGYRLTVPSLVVEGFTKVIAALTIAGLLLVLAFLVRRKAPAFSNVVSFISAAIIGLVRW